MKLNDIRAAYQSQPQRLKRHPASDLDVGTSFITAVMGTLMQVTTFNGEPIFSPEAFHMNQRALPLAKQQVLQG